MTLSRTKQALNITILRPDKLSYRVLFNMVQTYRDHFDHKFPDLIEFTPELMAAFKAQNLGEGANDSNFIGIPCIIDPKFIKPKEVKRK